MTSLFIALADSRYAVFFSLSLVACAAAQPAKTAAEEAVMPDTTDPSFTPPDESGVVLDTDKIELHEHAKKAKTDSAPMRARLPQRTIHTGTIHSAE